MKMLTARVPQDLGKELAAALVVQRFRITIGPPTFFFNKEVNLPRNFSRNGFPANKIYVLH